MGDAVALLRASAAAHHHTRHNFTMSRFPQGPTEQRRPQTPPPFYTAAAGAATAGRGGAQCKRCRRGCWTSSGPEPSRPASPPGRHRCCHSCKSLATALAVSFSLMSARACCFTCFQSLCCLHWTSLVSSSLVSTFLANASNAAASNTSKQ